MKFLVSPKANFSNTTTSIIIQDGADTISHLELPGEQDSIAGWYILFTYLRNAQPQELHDILGAIPQLLEIQVDEDAHPTYLNMLYALFKRVFESDRSGKSKSEVREHAPA